MRATIVGAAIPAKTMRAACARIDVPSKDVRTIGSRAWVALPRDARDAKLAALAEVLNTGLMVVDIDLPNGVAGDGVTASRATYRGVEEDISADATKVISRWASDGARVADDSAPIELAWALIEESSEGSNPASSNIEEIWAQSLFDQLMLSGKIELRAKHPPIAQLAHVLENPGRDLGERLLSELIDSSEIDEVFADAEELARLARETKPKRQ
jgi:hypothetical protein